MVLLDGATFKMFFLLLEAALRLLTWSTQATNRPPSTFRSPGGSGGSAQRVGTGKKKWSNRKAGEIIEEGYVFHGRAFF